MIHSHSPTLVFATIAAAIIASSAALVWGTPGLAAGVIAATLVVLGLALARATINRPTPPRKEDQAPAGSILDAADHVDAPFRPAEIGVPAEESTRRHVEPEGAPPPVDLEGFRTVLREGDIEEAMDDILGEFVKDAPGRLAALTAAAANEDASAIERAAHAFKSAAGTIRATSLAEVLRQTEAAGQSGNAKGAIELLQKVQSEYVATMSYLEVRIVGGHANA